MVAFSDKKNLSDGRSPLKGDILIVLSACATAAYMVPLPPVPFPPRFLCSIDENFIMNTFLFCFR